MPDGSLRLNGGAGMTGGDHLAVSDARAAASGRRVLLASYLHPTEDITDMPVRVREALSQYSDDGELLTHTARLYTSASDSVLVFRWNH